MIDEFLIGYSRELTEDNFEKKNERMFLKQKESYKLVKEINKVLDKRIKHQRIKKYGKRSKVRTALE